MGMSRQEIYDEMTGMFGLVPSFFKLVPDASLELEWKLFLTLQFLDGAIPNKFRELIGVGIAAVTKCEYCSLYHQEVARLNGATEEEIEDAVHYAKSSAGWSAYLNGMRVDKQQFADEMRRVVAYVRSKEAVAAD
jgi:AhpD family alkylhydroperoxidase